MPAHKSHQQRDPLPQTARCLVGPPLVAHHQANQEYENLASHPNSRCRAGRARSVERRVVPPSRLAVAPPIGRNRIHENGRLQARPLIPSPSTQELVRHAGGSWSRWLVRQAKTSILSLLRIESIQGALTRKCGDDENSISHTDRNRPRLRI